jgi:hypothetical protein
MVALISLIALVAAYLIADLLGRTSTDVAIERNQRTLLALQDAKAALVAWAADVSSTQPGSLPCPDTTNPPDGVAEGSCSGTTVVVGRLPWKTLGLDDLRDTSGERLWYAVSSNFRKRPYPTPGNTVVNGDTRGQLTIAGIAPVSNVVAVVIAPGAGVQTQSRLPGSGEIIAAANYLESTNALTSGIFTTAAQSSDAFNDKLIAVTEADLFGAVEPVVAARMENDVVRHLTAYYSLWGAFPYPVQFDSPDPGNSASRPQASYIGNATMQAGLLPVAASPSFSWVANMGAVTRTGGTGSISGTPSCGEVVVTSVNSWRCSFTAIGPNCIIGCSADLVLQVDGQVSNVGLTLAKFTSGSSTTDFLKPASSVTVTGASSVSATSLGVSLLSSGNGRVRYGATIQFNYSCTLALFGICFNQVGTTVTVTIPTDPAQISTLGTDMSDPDDGWFISNQWYRQTYYAVSPGHLPGGGATCAPLPGTPSCLTVTSLRPSYATANDKRAILILAGRSLNGTSRPSSNLGDYLESENSTPADYKFVHRAGIPTTANDRVVVVAP